MSALSSEQCRNYHPSNVITTIRPMLVRHISPRLSAFLMAFLFTLPIVWLGILQIKVPNTTSPFTNYLYSTLSFPFVDSLSSTNRSIFSEYLFGVSFRSIFSEYLFGLCFLLLLKAVYVLRIKAPTLIFQSR